jgi:plasmid segregation protein ParM
MIVGIDAGNNEVKVAGPLGLDRFHSAIGEFRERNIKETHGKDDIVFEYQGRKGFAGSLALAESEFSGSLMGDSKAHEDAKLRVLIALHRYSQTTNNFQLLVGQPISKHSDQEKRVIKEMLRGYHEISLNGVNKAFMVNQVEVAAEGGTAFWSRPVDGLIRIIDIGSGTVNCATLNNKRYIDKDSFTLPFGVNTVRTNDFAEMARGIVTHTSKKWDANDQVFLVGGAASLLLPHVQKFYKYSSTLNPFFDGKEHDPIFANAIGFYNIGTAVYG